MALNFIYHKVLLFFVNWMTEIIQQTFNLISVDA